MKGKTTLRLPGLLLLIAGLLLTISPARASHMAGSDLTYTYLGNNQVQVTFTFYRDCIGIDAPTEVSLNISSASCGEALFETLFPVPGTGQEISYSCPGAVTTCSGGSDPGIQEWEYTGIITLPANCTDWLFGVTNCCRNAAITTISTPDSWDMYVESYLNNVAVPDNNSPTFTNIPISFVCIGQDNFYNHGAIDIDGDSLVYSFVNPLNAPNVPLPYNSGYSISNPLTSSPPITIDPHTGDIFIHPTASEVGVVAVQVQEWRNGVLIGSVIRDIQVYTLQCNNDLPSATGIDGTNIFTLTTCVGGQICFNILSNDSNATDTLTMTWNNGIPAGTFTTNNAVFPTGTFCWTPVPADVRPQPYTFTVTVRDNACPSNGVQTYSYSIYVSQLNMTSNVTQIQCNGDHNGAISVTATGNGPFEYLWMPGEITLPSLTHLTAGTYSVDVKDALGCIGSQTFTIVEPAPLTVTATGVDPDCNGTPGSVTGTGVGGTPTYSYEWNTSPPSFGSTINNLGDGTYTVTVTDDHGCTATASVTITGNLPFTAAISSTPATCNANDGTVSVSTTGGSGQFTYTWTPNVSSGPTATNLPVGNYSVVVDDGNCSQTLNATVSASGVGGTVVSTTDASCSNSEDGCATVAGTVGQTPYSYLWTPGGDTTATVCNLAPGMYTVQIEDYFGCIALLSVQIGATNPAPVVDLGADTTICNGSTYVLDAGAGAASYLWSDNSTGQTLTVSTPGVYSVIVTDANGCQNSDAVNVNFITCITGQPSANTGSQSLSVYPNPFTDNIEVIVRTEEFSKVKISVFNILGDMLISKDVISSGAYLKEVLDLSTFSGGIYLVKVSTDEGEQSLRLIKE